MLSLVGYETMREKRHSVFASPPSAYLSQIGYIGVDVPSCGVCFSLFSNTVRYMPCVLDLATKVAYLYNLPVGDNFLRKSSLPPYTVRLSCIASRFLSPWQFGDTDAALFELFSCPFRSSCISARNDDDMGGTAVGAHRAFS